MSTRARGGSERTFEQISHSDTFPLFFPGRTSPSSSSPAYELEPRRAIANPVGTERDSSSPAGLLRADAEELSRRRFGAWAPVRTFEEVPDGPDGEEATGIEERWIWVHLGLGDHSLLSERGQGMSRRVEVSKKQSSSYSM